MTESANQNALTTANALVNPQVNAILRENLLAQSTRMSINVPQNSNVFNGGNTCTTELVNNGILQLLEVVVTMTITNTGTAVLAVGQNFPYGLIEKLVFKDYSNTTRIEVTGNQLYARNSFRGARIAYAGESFAVGAPNASPFAFPTSAAALAIAAGASAVVQIFLKIPISINLRTTKGAIYMAGSGAKCTLAVTFKSNETSASPAYDPFPGSEYTITNASVAILQNYLQPNEDNMQLPANDLSSVYALSGNRKEISNLAVNISKQINISNSAYILGTYVNFYNGASFEYGSDLLELRLRANSNVDIDVRSPTLWLMRQREILGADFLPGYYFSDSISQPILTNLLGQFQIDLKPASISGTEQAFVEVLSEQIYLGGAQLPGLSL